MLSGHILSRIYNCSKAVNRLAKRGGSRERERGVRGEAPEADAFIDFRTRPLGLFCSYQINDFKIIVANQI